MKIIIFISVLSVQFSICLSCPPGSAWRQSAVDSTKCYMIVAERKIWFDAEIACANLATNSHLTSIHSAFETANLNALVVDTASASTCDHFWIGGNDFDAVGNFTWSDGLSFIYTNWDSGQPELKNQCIQSKTKNGKWKVENCATANCFICEHYDVTATTTSSPTTSKPPNSGCDLTTLKYDFVLLFDVGENAVADNKRLLKLARDVAMDFSVDFTLGEKGTQFALLEYSDQAIPLATFKNFTDHFSLNTELVNGLGNHGIDGSAENRLERGFQAILDNLINQPPENTGYRPNATDVDHMVIFFTTKTPENITAANSAAHALRNHMFCYAGIASDGVNLSIITNFVTSLDSPSDVSKVVAWLQHVACL